MIGFYIVKVVAIFIMSVFYFGIGSLLSVLLNDAIPETKLEELSTVYLTAFLSAIFGSIGVVFYIVRNLVKRMPFFLDGLYGFKYSLLLEAAGGMIISYAMFSYLDRLQAMMVELGRRLRGKRVERKEKKGMGDALQA